MSEHDDHPLVSILVPIYNVEKYIERCLRSVFGQTYDNVEFVFVDDGSIDGSIDLLNRVIKDYPFRQERITLIHHQRNKGLAAARNSAIYECHGDFVLHVDSDDWVELTAVEVLVKRQQETGADIVYTSGYYRHKEDAVKVHCHGWKQKKGPLLENLLQDKATISIWSKLIKRSLYTDNDIKCDERASYYEDFQVLPRLIHYSKMISCLDAYIYHYERSNPNSIVTNIPNSIEIQRQGLLSIQVVCDFYEDKEQRFYDLVKGFRLRYIYRMLNVNYRERNKKGYYEFLHLLKRTERKDWHLIGWNKLRNRVMDSNYYVRLTTFPTYLLLANLWTQRIHEKRNR